MACLELIVFLSNVNMLLLNLARCSGRNQVVLLLEMNQHLEEVSALYEGVNFSILEIVCDGREASEVLKGFVRVTLL